jgi:hypothetical protein
VDTIPQPGEVMATSAGTITIREADTIWREQGGWFDARWHFSFDRYRDPRQMGIGALRVFNDDRIVAGAEWPLPPAPGHRVADLRRRGAASCTPIRSATTVDSSQARRRS